MNTSTRVHRMTIAAVLSAIGIIIPMFMPLKVVIPPIVSFTFASHVPIFIAMFISPFTAGFVAVITTLGFLLAGFPIEIVLRAATHLIFALGGALYLRSNKQILNSVPKAALFAFVIALIHGACEAIAVTPFFITGSLKEAFYSQGYLTTVLGLVGGGSVIHSMVDFFLALLIWKPLSKMKSLSGISSVPKAA